MQRYLVRVSDRPKGPENNVYTQQYYFLFQVFIRFLNESTHKYTYKVRGEGGSPLLQKWVGEG